MDCIVHNQKFGILLTTHSLITFPEQASDLFWHVLDLHDAVYLDMLQTLGPSKNRYIFIENTSPFNCTQVSSIQLIIIM